jgi:hypothetical protein
VTNLGQLLQWSNSLQIGPTVTGEERPIEGTIVGKERPPDVEK